MVVTIYVSYSADTARKKTAVVCVLLLQAPR